MKAEKDPKTGKWLIQYRYKDWTGKTHKSTKRGFQTKKEAEEWLRIFLLQKANSCNMPFRDFVELYLNDMRHRLREHTMINKQYIIQDKLIPFFGEKRLNEISVADIRAWQNSLIQQGYSQTYLKTINNQLSALFNYAVRYYELGSNPCRKAGSMGKAKAEEMQIWTKEEFQEFSDCLMDKRVSWMAFQILFWSGIRIGELFAAPPFPSGFPAPLFLKGQNRDFSAEKNFRQCEMGHPKKDAKRHPKRPLPHLRLSMGGR